MHPNTEDQKCCFHPHHIVIGICAVCLNERLLILASKQEELKQASSSSSSFNFSKFFAFTSLLNRFDNRLRHPKKTEGDYYSGASTSQEDSFISIKFEGSNVGSWEMGTNPKVSVEQCDNISWNQSLRGEVEGVTAVIEHSKTRGPLRWRKRIGHVFQLIRWKRPVKANVPPNLQGVKGRHGWIRSLTKRRSKD